VLRSEALSSLVRDLRERFHWVIIDSPPCVPFADATAIQAFVDGTILVVRARNTAKATVSRALEAIDAGVLLGVVLTDVQQTVVDKYYYGYDAYDPYRYTEHHEEEKQG
jgi:Mrp family chromosome partitioning ATPase